MHARVRRVHDDKLAAKSHGYGVQRSVHSIDIGTKGFQPLKPDFVLACIFCPVSLERQFVIGWKIKFGLEVIDSQEKKQKSEFQLENKYGGKTIKQALAMKKVLVTLA